jgi:bacterioferritin
VIAVGKKEWIEASLYSVFGRDISLILTNTLVQPHLSVRTYSLLEGISMNEADKALAIAALNRIMEAELAGVVKYTHYSLMVFGYNRIPIVSWLKGNADESLVHAHRAGELLTLLGGHPSLKIGSLLETEKHDIGDILRESLAHEKTAITAYYDLLKIAQDKSILLEEYAREMIVQEELHLDEVDKMLRRPGEIAAFQS